jgi:hypothetical protein
MHIRALNLFIHVHIVVISFYNIPHIYFLCRLFVMI